MGPTRRGQEVALYRLLLTAYPRVFRERHGEEMLRLFLEQTRDARRLGRVRLVRHRMSAAVDAVRSGVGERIDGWREDRRLAGTPMANARRGDERKGGGGMESLAKDIRYAARALLRNPGFSIVAVVTIGLGIGANTAIFSVVRTVLLEPLPYEEPQELVLLWGEMRNRGVTHFPMSPPDYADYRDNAEALEDLAAIWTFTVPLTGDGEPVQVDAASVTPNFFDLLGVAPLIGRGFVEEDGIPQPAGLAPGQPGGLPGIVVLSHALWQQRYAGAPDVIGRTIEIGGGPSEIVGVLPADFEMLMPPTAGLQTDADLWIAGRIDYQYIFLLFGQL